MTEPELKALLDTEQSSALGYLGGQLSADRKKAMEYYLAEPFGNEVEGRSKVVSSDVADTIEWILPALLKIFMSGDEVVSADPNGGEDVEGAKQATEYANFVFTRVNPGFTILYSMFKDALLLKTGTVKIYWEEKDKFEEKEFLDLPPDQFIIEGAQYEADGWEMSNHETVPMPEGEGMALQLGLEPALHSGAWTRTIKKGNVCIVPVPPDEFLISRNAKSIEDAGYVAHRCRKTATELIKAGYPKRKLDEIPEDDTDITGERTARMSGVDEEGGTEMAVVNRAMRGIMVTEAYIQVDWDGDGIAEMRKITTAGSGTVILDNEEWEGPRPFAAITPVIMPHRFHGMSMADLVMDLQLIKSTLWRQILDNMYLSNNAQKIVNPEAVEIDDLLTSRPGGLIRTKNGASPSEAVVPLEVNLVAAQAFPMFEYIDSVRENRTGVTRYNQGTDANSLNKTATGITQIMSAAQQRIELIARIFAETGVKDIFSHIIWLLRRYPDQAKRAIQLRNKEWVQMNPAQWKGDYDIIINVGLGTGNKDQMLGHLTTMLGIQQQALQFQGGADGPLVTLDNIYNTVAKLCENAGFKNVSEFFTDPKPKEGEPPKQPKPPPPNPELIKVQAQIEGDKAKLQMEGQKAQMGAKIEADRLQMDAQAAAQKAQMEGAIEAQKMQAEREARMEEMALKREIAMLEFELKKEIAFADLELKRQTARANAAQAAENAKAKAAQQPRGEA